MAFEHMDAQGTIDGEIANAGITAGLTREDFKGQCASFALRLSSKFNLPETTVDDIIESMANLVGIAKDISSSGADVQEQEVLAELKTKKRRLTCFRDKFGYIAPRRVYLGEAHERKRGKLVRKAHYGYIAPTRETLQQFLNQKDVFHEVCNPEFSESELMRDMLDGDKIRNLQYIKDHEKCLLITFYTDGLQICNPISAHRSHKLEVFYYTVLNLKTHRKSQWKNIHVYGICKSEYISMYGYDTMLRDFVSTMNDLYDGTTFQVGLRQIRIHGLLVAVLGDAPALSAIGHYKTGNATTRHPCLQCTITSGEMQLKLTVKELEKRCPNLHKERCKKLEKIKHKGRKNFWMKVWGITGTSVLLSLKHPVAMLIDPMHTVDHGVLNYNIALILQRALDSKYITLEYLNSRLRGWPYSYLDSKDIPEPLTRKQIFEDCQLKQTAASTRHMSYILPFILQDKFPLDDPYYKNFMRLVSISTLCASPIVTKDTSGEIQVQTETFLMKFKELYPRLRIRPKFHSLLHFCQQLTDWGPLRCHNVYRYESKNNFIKQMKPRSFKNVSYSLMARCQLHSCYQYISGGAVSQNYFNRGDEVKEGTSTSFTDEYPHLVQQYAEQVDGFDVTVATTMKLTFNGKEYRPGACLLISWDDNWPLFGRIDSLFVKNDVKFAVCMVMEATTFQWEANAYVVESTNSTKLIVLSTLDNTWPVPMYKVGSDEMIVNRFCHFGPGAF